jgi:histidine triad (HIT) family protein
VTGCTFCDIVRSSGRADVVLDEDAVVAFLDHRPLFPGHVLVVPRRHVVTLADLPDDLIEPLFGAVRRISTAVERAVEAQGTFVAANNRVSQSVPHLHVHVVPRRRGDGLKGFFWPRHPYRDDTHRRDVAAAIRAALG